MRLAVVAIVLCPAAVASPAVAQEPVAPANGQRIEGNEVILRWTLAPNWHTTCVQWASRPDTTYPGGPFLEPEGTDCALGARDVAYLLKGLRLGAYYWHVQVASNLCDEFDCEQTWGRTAYFNSVEPPPPPPPTTCSRGAAEHFADIALLPYARRRYRRYYTGITDWSVSWRCRDLTGDGKREMIVWLRCCTGGSLSPWAIFKHDRAGQWRMAYARIRDTVFRLGFRGRRVRTMLPAPYEGACTRYVRYRVVRWSGSRFRSDLTRRKRLRTRC